MNLKVENIQLSRCIAVLEKMPLKGLKSIHRTRLANQLKEKLDRVAEEEAEIRKEHSNLDENGEPIVKDDGTLDLKDAEAYKDTIEKFYTEKAVVDDGDSQVALKSVKKSLENCEEEWDGKEAIAFEHLYSGLEGSDKEDGDSNEQDDSEDEEE